MHSKNKTSTGPPFTPAGLLRKAILKTDKTFLVSHDQKLEGREVVTLCQTSDVVIDFPSVKGVMSDHVQQYQMANPYH